jgi:hypothetical protein
MNISNPLVAIAARVNQKRVDMPLKSVAHVGNNLVTHISAEGC